MKSWAIGWAMTGLILLGVGCSSHWANTETEFEGGCWEVADTLLLEFENSDTSKVYSLVFPVTLNEDYPYHNIYLHAVLEAPSGDRTLLPAEFVLADPTGKWLTEPDGDLIPFQLTVADGLRFNQTGKYSVKMFHFMRDSKICGVENAGIALDPVAK